MCYIPRSAEYYPIHLLLLMFSVRSVTVLREESRNTIAIDRNTSTYDIHTGHCSFRYPMSQNIHSYRLVVT